MNDLKAFLDGQLNAADAAVVQARLQSDAEFEGVANSFRRITASFGALTQGPASTGRERVLVAVSNPRPSAFPWRTAGAIASVLLLAVIALNTFPIYGQSKEGAVAAAVESEQAGPTNSPADVVSASPEFQSREDMRGRNADSGLPVTPPPASNSKVADSELFERKVVKTARLDVRVKSIDQAEAKVTAYIEGVRGYIENSTSSNLDGKSPSMTLTVRIPQPKFSEALSSFEKLGERTAKDVQASDVTQAIVDMEARLKNLRSQEETYRAILRSARKIGEIIDVQERLSVIRGEIESMQAQRDSMAKLAAMSTITLTLSQRPPPEESSSGGWVEDTWSNATYALSGAFKSLSVIGIWVLVYAPLWIPLSLFTLWGWRRALRA